MTTWNDLNKQFYYQVILHYYHCWTLLINRMYYIAVEPIYKNFCKIDYLVNKYLRSLDGIYKVYTNTIYTTTQSKL